MWKRAAEKNRSLDLIGLTEKLRGGRNIGKK